MLYHGPNTVAHIPAGQTVQVMDFNVPSGQVWRPQLFVLERIAGSGTVIITAHVHPSGSSVIFLAERVEFAGNSLQRSARSGAWGPGDHVVLSVTAPAQDIDLKILAAVLIDEGVQRYAAPPPGPYIDTITPSSVLKGPAQSFTLVGTRFDIIQQGVGITIRRPNSTTVGRPATYVDLHQITFTYANIDLVGPYAVWASSGAVATNEVVFTAT